MRIMSPYRLWNRVVNELPHDIQHGSASHTHLLKVDAPQKSHRTTSLVPDFAAYRLLILHSNTMAAATDDHQMYRSVVSMLPFETPTRSFLAAATSSRFRKRHWRFGSKKIGPPDGTDYSVITTSPTLWRPLTGIRFILPPNHKW